MKALLIGLLVGVSVPIALLAQTVDTTPTAKLVWDQGAATLAEANTLRIKSYLGTSTEGTIEAFSCVGSASPFTCTTTRTAAQIAGTSQNNTTHTVKLGASLPLSGGGFSAESLSAVCTFRFPAAPTAPVNLRFVLHLIVSGLHG